MTQENKTNYQELIETILSNFSKRYNFDLSEKSAFLMGYQEGMVCKYFKNTFTTPLKEDEIREVILIINKYGERFNEVADFIKNVKAIKEKEGSSNDDRLKSILQLNEKALNEKELKKL